MANWVADFLARNPDLAARPIAKRARHSIHFDMGGGQRLAAFVGKPCHYENGPGNWEPIDTALVNRGSYYSPTGVPIRVTNGEVSIEGGTYKQRPARVVRLRPSNGGISTIATIPSGGTISGDTCTRSGTGWSHVIRITEDGAREECTLTVKPTFPGGTREGDYICVEEVVTGVSFPDGWLDTEYQADGYTFNLPTAHDANDDIPPVRRYAKTSGGVQYLYTGILKPWFDTAAYPVVIDPDFTGDTADGYIRGMFSTDWATARNTSSLSDNESGVIELAVYRLSSYYRPARGYVLFDTSAITADATVTQVNLKLTAVVDNSTLDSDIYIIKQNWTSPVGDANRESNFDNVLTAAKDDSIWRNTNGMSLNTQYTSGNLAVAWVNKTGTTYYALAGSHDYNNSAPANATEIHIGSQDNATAGYRPVLTVLYSSGTTGTAAVRTQPALITAAGVETFTGSAAQNAQAATMAATGTVTTPQGDITGTSVFIGQPVKMEGSGAESFTGTGQATIQPAQLTASGAEAFTGTAALTGQAAQITAAAAEANAGTAALSAQPARLSASGALTFSATATVQASSIDLTGSATQTITGTASVQVQPASITGAAALASVGTGSVQTQPVAVTSAGAEEFTGTAAESIQPVALSATGAVVPEARTATAAITAQPAQLEATGTMTLPGIAGTAAIAAQSAQVAAGGTVVPPAIAGIADVTLQPASIAGTAAEEFAATGTVIAQPAQLAATGTVVAEARTGTGVIITQPAQLTAEGALTFPGAGAVTAQPAAIAAEGNVLTNIDGTGSVQLQPAALAATGAVVTPIEATGSVTVQPAGITGTAAESFDATGAVSAQAAYLIAEAELIISGAASVSAQPAQLSAEAIEQFIAEARVVAATAIITGSGSNSWPEVTGIGAVLAPFALIYSAGHILDVMYLVASMSSAAVFAQTLTSSAVDEGAASNAAVNEETLTSANVDRGGLTSRLVNTETVTVQ